ncbi:MAG: 5-methylthioadenosine/S-adenosylhomocysteine deaminase [Polyangiales bacterium]
MLWASNRVVFEGPSGRYDIEPGWVRAEGRTIAACGRGPAPPGAQHFGDKLLTPAFVDPHTHLALVALRGFDPSACEGNVVEDLFYRFESQLSPSDVAAFARVGAYEALLNGIGMVWDHYFHAESLAAAIADVGLSAVIAPTVQDLSGPGVETLEQAYEASVSLNTDAWRERNIYSCVGPHATDTVSAEHWARVTQLARTENLPLHAHLAQSPEEVARCLDRHGCTPLRWLDSLGVLQPDVRSVFAHAIFVTRNELALLGESQTLVACPHAQLLFGLPARFDVWSEEKVRWTLATDASASNDSVNLLKELRFAAGWRTAGASWSAEYESFLDEKSSAAAVWKHRQEQAKQVPVDGLLDKVWGMAGSLHPQFRAGVIEPGGLANLLVWDTDHPGLWPADNPLHALVYGDAAGAIHAMAVGGQTVGVVGDFARSLTQSEGYREAQKEARARLRALAF